MKGKNKNLKNQRKVCKIKTKGEKGITLIALVVTIIVLLILAGITINLLFSDNGIIKKAQEAAEVSNKAVQNDIDTLKDLDDLIKKETGETPDDGIYSEPGAEEKIAPAELFDWEPISTTTGKIATNSEVTLPTKEARIKRIFPQYCNEDGYNPETGECDLTDTNYEIIFNGEKISDTLVIPYQLEKDGEFYKVTEVNLSVLSGLGCHWPSGVKTIIFPNTVKHIYVGAGGNTYQNYSLQKVVLSNSLEELSTGIFSGCTGLTNITIPPSVTKIEYWAFANCYGLKSITIPDRVTTIDSCAFFYCSLLENINISNSVTNIGNEAFCKCSSLKSITIPSNVNSIGQGAFAHCSKLTDINIKKPEGSITGAPWWASSSTNVNWNYTGE